jgi:hypothetical protein
MHHYEVLQAAAAELSPPTASVSPLAASELLIGGLFKAEAVAGE